MAAVDTVLQTHLVRRKRRNSWNIYRYSDCLSFPFLPYVQMFGSQSTLTAENSPSLLMAILRVKIDSVIEKIQGRILHHHRCQSRGQGHEVKVPVLRFTQQIPRTWAKIILTQPLLNHAASSPRCIVPDRSCCWLPLLNHAASSPRCIVPDRSCCWLAHLAREVIARAMILSTPCARLEWLWPALCAGAVVVLLVNHS